MRQASLAKIRSCAFKLGIWTCLLMIAPQLGWAAGTQAGTSISNTATLSYSIGAVPQTDVAATSAAFVVDEKINLTVAGGVITNVATGSTVQATAFTVTNNSNSPLDFSLAVTSLIAGDNFDPTACNAFVESGATAGYQALQDTATFIDELAPDATATVYAVCNIPAALVNGDTGLVGITATARGNFNAAGYVASPGVLGGALAETAANTANVDIVFADVAGTEDIARDAKHSAHNTYVISGAAVTVIKTASVVDPSGGIVVMPGAVITYTITVNISGSGTVNNLVITDPLPANTAYVTNSIIVDGVAQTDANDPPTDNTDFGITTANTATVSLGNVAAPANHIIKFRATIN